MRAPERAETNFKWRPAPASSWYAGVVSIVEGKPNLSSILLFGDELPDKLHQVRSVGIVSASYSGILPEYISALQTAVSSEFGMQIETLGTMPPPVAPGETIPDFADYLQLSE